MPNNVLCSFARALLAFTHVSCYNHDYDKERKRGRERKKKDRKGVERKKKEKKRRAVSLFM
jgi:prophage tail gpP-like protein